jgi:uncharacterized protein YndB with AHSA1/START domain
MEKTAITAEPGTNQVVITRTFDAPRELVYRCFTEPELITKWWGPRRYTTTIETMEVRKGGLWRFVQHGPEGEEYGFWGVTHDLVAPERVVQTFEFEGVPGHVAMETLVLEDLGGKTRMVQMSVFQSVADRDGMVASGMESGVVESHERLDELVKELRGQAT